MRIESYGMKDEYDPVFYHLSLIIHLSCDLWPRLACS
jgi:hypothetical protein